MMGATGASVGSVLLAAAVLLGPGIANPQRAHTNWVLNCQGCHRADATGSPKGAPNMAGEVAKFLSVKGGREFLGRVPGVANAPLPDDQLAELVNWLLLTFDRRHLPKDFAAYTANEIGRLRAQVLINDAATVRARLLAKMQRSGFNDNGQAKRK